MAWPHGLYPHDIPHAHKGPQEVSPTNTVLTSVLLGGSWSHQELILLLLPLPFTTVTKCPAESLLGLLHK